MAGPVTDGAGVPAGRIRTLDLKLQGEHDFVVHGRAANPATTNR